MLKLHSPQNMLHVIFSTLFVLTLIALISSPPRTINRIRKSRVRFLKMERKFDCIDYFIENRYPRSKTHEERNQCREVFRKSRELCRHKLHCYHSVARARLA